MAFALGIALHWAQRRLFGNPQRQPQPPRGLSAAELEHYHTHGYVVVRAVLTADDFRDIEREYTELIDVKAAELAAAGTIQDPAAGEPFASRLARIADQCSDQAMTEQIAPFGLTLDTMYALRPGVFKLFFSPRLLKAIESVVGPEITLNPIQHLRPYLPSRDAGKSQTQAGAAALALWHQDQGVTREEADASEILTCWIPLVDVSSASGCLQVLPGKVEGGLLPHVKTGAGTTIDPRLIAPNTEGVSCEMKRGDLLFINRFTPHRGQVNTTDTVRWSIDLRFQKTGTPTGRPFWPEFVLQSPSGRHAVQDDFGEWVRRWKHDLVASKGERWHRVAGDVGGGFAEQLAGHNEYAEQLSARQAL